MRAAVLPDGLEGWMTAAELSHPTGAVQHFLKARAKKARQKLAVCGWIAWGRVEVARRAAPGLVEPRSAPTSWERLGVNRTRPSLLETKYDSSIEGCTPFCHIAALHFTRKCGSTRIWNISA